MASWCEPTLIKEETMGCCGGQGPREGSPEEGKGFKPENNGGCGSGNTGCDGQTRASQGSPRWLWEQENGKLVTVLTTERVEVGFGVTAIVQSYRREVCEKSTSAPKKGCCAIRYKVIR